MKYNKNTIKNLFLALFMLINIAVVSAVNTGVGYADRAQDFCNETVPQTNSSTAGDNVACVNAAREAERRCTASQGTGSSGLQCIENYYAGLRGVSSGDNSGDNNDPAGGGTDPGFNEESSVIGADQGDCNETPMNRQNCGIVNLLVILINFLSAVAGVALVASLMLSGYLYMTARDNPGQIEKAKSRIVQTLIALTVFIFMYALLNFLVPGGVL